MYHTRFIKGHTGHEISRMQHFDYFPKIKHLLIKSRKKNFGYTEKDRKYFLKKVTLVFLTFRGLNKVLIVFEIKGNK